jgi:hypothetical protein
MTLAVMGYHFQVMTGCAGGLGVTGDLAHKQIFPRCMRW